MVDLSSLSLEFWAILFCFPVSLYSFHNVYIKIKYFNRNKISMTDRYSTSDSL